ncbi:MAG TPA: hypothetical protein VI318_06255 [Baekduia sp.]
MASQDPSSGWVRRGPYKNGNIDPAIVCFHQRARLMEAVATAVADGGHRHATAVRVADIAGVSKRTIYELGYENADALVAAAYADAAATGARYVMRAFDAEATWAVGLRGAIHKYFELLASHDRWARAWVVAGHGAPAGVRAARTAAVGEMTARLVADGVGRLAANAVVDVVDGVARRGVMSGAGAELSDSADVAAGLALRLLCSPRDVRAALSSSIQGPRRRPGADRRRDVGDWNVASLRAEIARGRESGDGALLWRLLEAVGRESPLAPQIVAGFRGSSTTGVPVGAMLRSV